MSSADKHLGFCVFCYSLLLLLLLLLLQVGLFRLPLWASRRVRRVEVGYAAASP